ncbi:ATP-binding protein [Streptomyces actinomycinicus]|uniref:ATP-binding protein n=1 Tax=Streptomyces actinomycinicus TaxID=1695166 RepID=A0A937EQJ3_9ACTN|nr:ATP-binding protein [Streptomyces actinomycinicus]MBL1086738.1 ATP-binding protein [Streptomyces actinomycinicus]
MTSIYLSSANSRWTPKSEGDLSAAISGGLLEESHYLDLKEQTDPGKAGNKELARDLASFAVDGGTLIIGIREDKANRTFHLAPQPLKGLPEKVEQVARSLADPPLNVLTDVIEASANDGTGYLIVHIPASAAAPHMVDGRYYGRGDKTKYHMADTEVVRHHLLRKASETDALSLLQQEIDQDPLGQYGEQSHFFLVAQPTAGRGDMLLDLTSGTNWKHRLTELVNRAYTPELNTILSQFTPDLSNAIEGHRRAGGAALATHNLADGRLHTPTGQWGDEDTIEVQFLEDGGLRLYSSRLSDNPGESNGGEQALFDTAAVGLTRRTLEVIRLTAEQAGYFGNWSFAVGATRLQGRRRYTGGGPRGFSSLSASYTRDTYTQATGATWADLNATPGAITARLLGSLLRSLGSQDLFAKALSD